MVQTYTGLAAQQYSGAPANTGPGSRTLGVAGEHETRVPSGRPSSPRTAAVRGYYEIHMGSAWNVALHGQLHAGRARVKRIVRGAAGGGITDGMVSKLGAIGFRKNRTPATANTKLIPR